MVKLYNFKYESFATYVLPEQLLSKVYLLYFNHYLKNNKKRDRNQNVDLNLFNRLFTKLLKTFVKCH